MKIDYVKIGFYSLVLTASLALNGAATLEERLADQWSKSPDIASNIFNDFIAPNELHPFNIKKHLDLLTEEGLLVSTGTERSLIAFALCKKCTGLVGVDINPKVKGFNDFNTLLLRISKDRKEYLEFRLISRILAHYDSSIPSANESIDDIIDRIENRLIDEESISELAKKYYVDNFDKLAKIFFTYQENDRAFLEFFDAEKYKGNGAGGGYFENANYLYNDELFFRLQKAAKDGSMIFTVNSINDLKFLIKEKIVAIDASNIHDYIKLDLESDAKIIDERARIIWVHNATLTNEEYRSYIPRPNSPEIVEKCQIQQKQLIKEIEAKSSKPSAESIIAARAASDYADIAENILSLIPSSTHQKLQSLVQVQPKSEEEKVLEFAFKFYQFKNLQSFDDAPINSASTYHKLIRIEEYLEFVRHY
jgi:hypothetical protein